MGFIQINNIVLSVIILPFMFCNTCTAIKCFACNSANNSACSSMDEPRMRAIVPVVDCTKEMGKIISNEEFFCRKIIQTILDGDKSPELRITRGCGWVKHNRDCYNANNMDHLETVCQCFEDMCNAATSLQYVKVTVLTTVAALFSAFKTWRGNI